MKIVVLGRTILHIKGRPRTGLVCIVLGIFLILLAVDVERGGGYRPTDENTGVSSILSVPVLAQQLPDPAPPPAREDGWAYLGVEDEDVDWSFETLVSVPDSEIAFMRARRRVTLLEDHYEGLTGSFVGTLLGYRVPDPTGREIDVDECVRVLERTVVASDKVWLKVVPEECETIHAVLKDVREYVEAKPRWETPR